MPKDYTASEIIDMVEKKRNSEAFQALLDQMESDFDILALEPFVPEPGHQAYTSPKPKNDFGKVFTGVNKSSLTWRIVTPEDATENERKAANRGEQFLSGIIDLADKQLSAVGEPSLRVGAAWFGCGRGASGMKCLLYTGDDKETHIDIKPLDPMQMAWERGTDGMAWLAFLYPISKLEVKERYNVELASETAVIIDFFDREINAIVLHTGEAVGGDWIKPPTAHGLKRPPMWVGFAGGMPTVWTKDGNSTLKHQAMSVFNSARNIYKKRNEQASLLLDIQEKAVVGSLVHEMEPGMEPIKGDPHKSFQIINLIKDREKLYPLESPRVPPETAALMGLFDRDLQESTVPFPVGYGLDPQAHSGAALAMLNDNTRSIYGPFCSLLANAFRWLCEEILSQFKTKGQKINLKGYDQNGKFFVLEATQEDIQDDWYIEVKCEPKLPRDEAAELEMALRATAPRPPHGRPFLSEYTAREKIIKQQDPDAEDKLIERQMVKRQIEQMPSIQLRRVANELIDQGDTEGAMELLQSLPSPMQGAGGPPQGPEGGMPPGAAPPSAEGQQVNPEILRMIALRLTQQGRPIPPQLAAMIQGQMPPTGLQGGFP